MSGTRLRFENEASKDLDYIQRWIIIQWNVR